MLAKSPKFLAHLANCLAVLVMMHLIAESMAADPQSELVEDASKPVFSSPVLDLGLVVGDLEVSATFYRDALGCREVQGFTANGSFAASIGLVDHMDVTARVFLLGEGPSQSRIKMMSFPQAHASKSDQRFIHSTLGFSYLTLHVLDLDASMKRLKASKVSFEGKTPVSLGGGNALLVIRDPDGNFIELIGPSKTVIPPTAEP
ncbi:MAG: VOC family protein [Limisphaerales bacterium]|jgi:catechol 2,3-dioxygenase-like lactoylglutathione lyase family enzyme|nr:VOC family protein [Verrucomicrobiota bacterium]